MTVRLLVVEGAGRGVAPGARLVGAAGGGAVLVLGAVPPSDDARDAAANADAAVQPPFTFSLEDMLPHGLAVVGCVAGGGGAAGRTPSPIWITLDPSTGEFCVGGAPAMPMPLPRPARSSGLALLPPNDAFVLVRATMPAMRAQDAEALLQEGGPSPLFFGCRCEEGGFVMAAVAAEAAAAAATTTRTAAQLDGATFEALVDSAAVGAGPEAALVFEYRNDDDDDDGKAAARPPSVLHLDALAVVPASAPLAGLARDHLAPALRAQLRLARRVAASALAAAAGGKGRQTNLPPQKANIARAAHFLPPRGPGFPVTLIYPLPPVAADEAALAGLRRAVHATLGLAMDRPLLRLANAVAVAGGSGSGGAVSTQTTKKLLNVHESIPHPPPLSGPNVTTSLVEGDYEYCHYLQDGAKDAGWGCAYRSLQTLCSWFRAQRLAPPHFSQNNPTHAEIQRALVKIGDKPASFLGSSQWIGAIEVGYVLDELYGCQCRVVTASRGDEVAAQAARKLCAHFSDHGTPVMVGGGVLAYTLLGVQFDEDTGDAAFLILDPHYTGGDSDEDLAKKILPGGWVAWKRPGEKAAGSGGELFVVDAFYNFLCPMRPREV